MHIVQRYVKGRTVGEGGENTHVEAFPGLFPMHEDEDELIQGLRRGLRLLTEEDEEDAEGQGMGRTYMQGDAWGEERLEWNDWCEDHGPEGVDWEDYEVFNNDSPGA